jgi:FixJ family two-component response regulator
MSHLSGRESPAADSVLYVVGGTDEERRSLVALLGRLGRDILSKETAEEMLAELPRNQPFVLISAISLPGMSGMELLRELRRRGISAPTILISDESDIPTAVDAIRAGATDFIERPFIDRILLRRVQSALESSSTA